jgi:hypothetical protein
MAGEWRRSGELTKLLPENPQPLKHLRQKRHRKAPAAREQHPGTGNIIKFGDNVGVEGGVVAGQ